MNLGDELAVFNSRDESMSISLYTYAPQMSLETAVRSGVPV